MELWCSEYAPMIRRYFEIATMPASEMTPELEAECKDLYTRTNEGIKAYGLKPLPSYPHLNFTLDNT